MIFEIIGIGGKNFDCRYKIKGVILGYRARVRKDMRLDS
jgi:hypothetical protein